ncbi:hypothetical protein DFH28DRAFT_1117418 [Melampsora americana]|nr:hypothetical protein DFH28DRAFT_1117418 [Melampsora americana]
MANIPNSPNPSLPHYIPIDKDGNALLQSPPIDTVYKDLEAIYAYVDPLTIPHGYKLSVLDSRYMALDSHIDFKCYKGQTRHARSSGDCPFSARADRKLPTDSWTLTIINPHHNHPPATTKLSFHKPKNFKKTSSISTEYESKESKTHQNILDRPKKQPSLAKRYPQLISRLKALDYDSQKSLLDVIDAELDIAELNKVAIDHLNHEAKNPVKIQQQENDSIKKANQPIELLKNKATTSNSFDKENQPLKTCKPPELGIAQAVSGITGPQSTDRISSPNTPIPSTLPSPHLIKKLDVEINKDPPVNVNIHKESPPETMSTPPPFTWVEENEEDEKFETPNETFPSIPAQVKPIAFIEQSLTQDLIPPAPEIHTNEENNSLNDEDQQGSAKNSNTKATNPPLPLENLKSKKRKKKAVKCKEKSQPEPEKPSEQSRNSLVPVSNSKRQKKNHPIQAAESNDLAPPPPASHSNPSKADSAPQVPKPKQTLRQPKKKNGPIAPTRSSSRIKRKDASIDLPPPIHSDLDAPRTDEPAKELISGLHQQEASQGKPRIKLTLRSKALHTQPEKNSHPPMQTINNDVPEAEVAETLHKCLSSLPYVNQLPSYFNLGRSVQEATTIRQELQAEVMERYDWYEKNIPDLCINYDITKILEILQNPEDSAGPDLWYPMPGGSTLIANRYKQPVLFYTTLDSAAMHTFPFFSPPPSNIKPIIIAHVQDVHYISLELNITPDLPIPVSNHEWARLHDECANGWAGMYETNYVIFRNIARVNRKERDDKDQTQTRLSNPVSLLSSDESEDRQPHSGSSPYSSSLSSTSSS